MKSRVWNFSDPKKFTKSLGRESPPRTAVNYLFFLRSISVCLIDGAKKKIEDREREEKNRDENLFIER